LENSLLPRVRHKPEPFLGEEERVDIHVRTLSGFVSGFEALLNAS
jgi:hypothetical protein